MGDNIEALDPRAPGGRPEKPQEHGEQRSLAGPVRAQEPVDLAGADREIEAGEGLDVTVPLRETDGFDHHRRPRRAPWNARLLDAAARRHGRRWIVTANSPLQIARAAAGR
jgi:hypothetical protein